MAPLLDSELIKQVVARMAAQESPADPMFPRMAAGEPRIAQDDTEESPVDRRWKYPPRQRMGIPRRSDELPPPAKLSDMVPMLLGQLSDLATTEIGVRGPARLKEGNPIPGLGSTGGRVVSALVNALAVDRITRMPALRKFREPIIRGNTAKHAVLAISNNKMIQDEAEANDRWERFANSQGSSSN
jgi:hypothetical protein